MESARERIRNGSLDHATLARTVFALESNGVGIWELDCEKELVWMDPAWLDRLGVTGFSFPCSLTEARALLHPDDLAVHSSALRRHMQDPSVPYAVELRYRRADGTYCWVSSHGKVAEFTPTGSPKKMVGTHQDFSAHKKVLERAQLLEVSWKKLLAILPVGVYLTDKDGGCMYLNPAWEKLSGMSALDAIGQGWERAIAPEDRKRLLEKREKNSAAMLESASPEEIEFRFQHPNGDQRWVRSYSVPIKTACDQIVARVGTVTDVSSLHASIEGFRNFVEMLPTGAVFVDGEAIRLNRECEKILGQDRHQISNLREWMERVLGTGSEDQLSRFRETLSQLDGEAMTLNIVRPDGRRRSVELRANKGEGFQVWHLQDVTEQRQAEERFRVIFEQSSYPQFLYNEEGILACNEATLSAFGAKKWSEVVDRDPWSFSPLLQPDGVSSRQKAAQIENLVRQVGTQRFEWIQNRIGGGVFPSEVTLSEVTLQSKSYFLASWHDITEQKERQAQVAQSFKMASLGEMAAGLAHEVNNPLTIIKSKAEQLLSRAERAEILSSADVVKNAKVIDETVERISKIVRGLKSFARDSDFEPPVETDLRRVVEDTLSFSAERFRNHGIELKVQVPKSPALAYVRPVQISQVILNLLGNAFDAVQDRKKPWVHIDLENGPAGPVLSCTDSGPGIPADLRSRIMEPFFTTKEIGRGTGLGLSISRGLIESNRGRFYFDETSPQTRFVIELRKPSAEAGETLPARFHAEHSAPPPPVQDH